jgi:hypothetical protein
MLRRATVGVLSNFAICTAAVCSTQSDGLSYRPTTDTTFVLRVGILGALVAAAIGAKMIGACNAGDPKINIAPAYTFRAGSSYVSRVVGWKYVIWL